MVFVVRCAKFETQIEFCVHTDNIWQIVTGTQCLTGHIKANIHDAGQRETTAVIAPSEIWQLIRVLFCFYAMKCTSMTLTSTHEMDMQYCAQ